MAALYRSREIISVIFVGVVVIMAPPAGQLCLILQGVVEGIGESRPATQVLFYTNPKSLVNE